MKAKVEHVTSIVSTIDDLVTNRVALAQTKDHLRATKSKAQSQFLTRRVSTLLDTIAADRDRLHDALTALAYAPDVDSHQDERVNRICDALIAAGFMREFRP